MNEISVDKLGELMKKLYLIGDRKSQLWLGSPGIGKSEVVRQIAQQIAEENKLKYIEYHDDLADKILENPDRYFVLVDLRLTEVEPSDLIGIPRDMDGAVVYKPLLWARVLNKCAGILFLDELTNVQRPDVISCAYKLLLDRKAGFVPFHKDVLVIAAGNSPEHSSVANMLPAPVINRVRIFNVKQPRLDDWKEYMDRSYGDNWDKRVYAFLSKYTNFFMMQPKDVETLIQFATPRTWTALATVSSQLEDSELEHVAIATVGEEAGSHFAAFCKVSVPDLETLIKDPSIFDTLVDEARYFVAVQLSNKITEIIRNNDKKYFNKMHNLLMHLYNTNREIMVLSIFMIPKKERITLGTWMMKDSRYKDIIQYLIKQVKVKTSLISE